VLRTDREVALSRFGTGSQRANSLLSIPDVPIKDAPEHALEIARRADQ
jgi:hypothetical protein